MLRMRLPALPLYFIKIPQPQTTGGPHKYIFGMFIRMANCFGD